MQRQCLSECRVDNVDKQTLNKIIPNCIHAKVNRTQNNASKCGIFH